MQAFTIFGTASWSDIAQASLESKLKSSESKLKSIEYQLNKSIESTLQKKTIEANWK